jgi:hypothetical protein
VQLLLWKTKSRDLGKGSEQKPASQSSKHEGVGYIVVVKTAYCKVIKKVEKVF